MPARAFQWQLVAWLAIAALSAYCLFWGGAWVATYYTDLRIWALIPAFAVVAVWVVAAWRDGFWRPRTVLGPAFAAAFAAFAISTVASRSPRFSVEYLALAILLTSLYLILQRLMASPFFRPRMIGFAILAAVLIGFVYVGVTVARWIVWWDTIGRFAAPPLRPFFEGLTLGNPSAVMTASVLLTAPAVAHLATGSMSMRIAASGLVVLAGMATIISGSRAGWLAIGISVVVIGALWLIAPERRAALIAVGRSRTGRLAAVAIVVLGLVAAIIVAPGFLFRATAGGEGLRATYWAAAIRMFESSPLVGTGPGTWVPQRVTNTLADEPDYYIPHAHNVYVQTAAEFGVVGLLAGAVVVVLLGRLLVDAIRDPEPARSRMGWVALFATVYFAAHQLLDFYANAPAILLCFAIPIAWLDATAPVRTSRPPRMLEWVGGAASRLSRAIAIGGIVALVASAAFVAWSEAGALQMSQGTHLLDAGRPAEAIEPLTSAVRHDPAMTPYHLELGIALADTGDLEGAEAHLVTAATADGLPETWLNLAAVRAQLGDQRGSEEALSQALRLGDQQVGVLIPAGDVYLQLGDRDAAVAVFTSGLISNPTLAGDPWWTVTPERSAVWPQVYGLAFDRAAVSSQFAMALQTGDEAAATAAIEAMDTETATTSGLVQRAWAGDERALADLEARARERPLDVGIVSWCAMLHRRSGHPGRADAFVAWADTINGDARLGGYETRVATTTKPARIAGLSTLYYGHYTYRRPVSDHQLVDWLPELGYE